MAIEVYQDALRNSPNNQDLIVLLGIAYEQDDNKSKAAETFRKALDKNPQNEAAKAGLKRVQ